jgi:magnesium transporter
MASQATRSAHLHEGGAGRHDIDPAFVARVIGCVGDRDAPGLRALLLPLHPADSAEVLHQVAPDIRAAVVHLIGADLDADVYAELSVETREEVLKLLPARVVGRLLAELDSDDAAAVAADVDEEQLDEVLANVPDEDRAVLEQSLSFEEETAGRLMQREFVAAPEHWSVGDAIDHMRKVGDDLPDRFFEIYIVDPAWRPLGAVALAPFLKAGRQVPLLDLMEPAQVLIRSDMDQEEVAYLFSKYHLHSAPVVDEGGRIKGMITLDDIVTVVEEERGEDLLALAGVGTDGDNAGDSVVGNLRARTPWLAVNLFTALLASTAISMFEATIEEIVALAVLMPIVASLGGNTGTQTLAVAVRALAQRDLTAVNAARVILREVTTGSLNGLIFGLLLALVAGLWFQSAGISLAVGLAVVINLTAAGLAGILVPLTLKRFGADPAVASSVFVTFVTDLIGFSAFLGLATVILLQ